tara:strand:+ start:112773 stop:112892 length:120 start_codon:yes stop_codon:yes gene_type:complete
LEQLNINLAAVYSTRSKVQQMIRNEIELLENDSVEVFAC